MVAISTNHLVKEGDVAAVKGILKYADSKHHNKTGLDHLKALVRARAGHATITDTEVDAQIDSGIRAALGILGYTNLTQENGSMDVALLIAAVMEHRIARSTSAGEVSERTR